MMVPSKTWAFRIREASSRGASLVKAESAAAQPIPASHRTACPRLKSEAKFKALREAGPIPDKILQRCGLVPNDYGSVRHPALQELEVGPGER